MWSLVGRLPSTRLQAHGDAAVDGENGSAVQQPWADAPPATAVHAAAAAGDVAYLQGAYDVGGLAAVDVPDTRGRTPLMHALRYDHLRTARWLLGKGANVNAQSHDSSTALHHACHSGSEAVVKFLLTGPVVANPRLTDKEGRTPLHWACHNKSVKALEAMLEHGGLTMADINAGDSSGMTACMWACYSDNVVRLHIC